MKIMKIKLALTKEAIRYGGDKGYTCILGKEREEFFFDDDIAKMLDKENFIEESWEEFESLADWGDYDFFFPERCKLMKPYFERKLKETNKEELKIVYGKMLDYVSRAIELDTGIAFDF